MGSEGGEATIGAQGGYRQMIGRRQEGGRKWCGVAARASSSAGGARGALKGLGHTVQRPRRPTPDPALPSRAGHPVGILRPPSVALRHGFAGPARCPISGPLKGHCTVRAASRHEKTESRRWRIPWRRPTPGADAPPPSVSLPNLAGAEVGRRQGERCGGLWREGAWRPCQLVAPRAGPRAHGGALSVRGTALEWIRC